jgi:hypothetical protein
MQVLCSFSLLVRVGCVLVFAGFVLGLVLG